MLYAFSPQEIATEAQYFSRYQGDDYVDIFGLDDYRLSQTGYVTQLGNSLDLIANLAEERGKISALTEVGADQVPESNWWTDCLLDSLKYNVKSRKTAWALVWRNASEDHFFGPYPGHPSVQNFMMFYNDSLPVFESDLPDMYTRP